MATENKAYIEGMREIRRSNKAGTHDSRPNRERSRDAVRRAEIRRGNETDTKASS